MQMQQEEASRRAFKESLLKHSATNTGSDLPDMENDSDADNRRDRINKACTTPPMKPKSYDLTLMDDTPFETPRYEQSTSSDLPNRTNRRLYFEEQEKLTSFINNNSKLKTSEKKQLNI